MPTYNFTIRATDSAGAFADRAFSIDVTNSNVENFVVCAAGGSPSVMTSKDGISWTNRGTASYFRSVCFGNNRWVGVTTTSIATSTDAINWTYTAHATALPSLSTLTPVTIAFGNGVFLIGTYVSSGANAIYYSTDGTTWTKSATAIGSAGAPSAFANNGSKWLLDDTSNSSSFFVSNDNGVTWSTTPKPVSGNFSGLKCAAGVWMSLVEASGTSYVSYDNATTWGSGATGWNSGISRPSLTYGNGIWVGGSGAPSGNRFGRSTDTMTFTDFNTTALSNQVAFGFAAGRFVYANLSGTAGGYSTEGITWTTFTYPQTINSVSPYMNTAHIIGCRV